MHNKTIQKTEQLLQEIKEKDGKYLKKKILKNSIFFVSNLT